MTNSNHLISLIRTEIETNGGKLSFARFMDLALYHPEFGYYTSSHFDIGRTGDFTTASELSPIYAECFAVQCREIQNALPNSSILELGAGTGRFAGNLLRHLNQANAKCGPYYIYEISAPLRAKQAALIAAEYPELINDIIWLDNIPNAFRGIVIANEVLDALPVTCFSLENHAIKERVVTTQDDQFIFTTEPASVALSAALTPLMHDCDLPADYASEINLTVPHFMQALCGSLQQGVILFADYGYGEREYYHPERNEGSLTCFYQHHRHNNPLIHPGLQDITAHVNFTQVVTQAVAFGCRLAGFTTQAAFLLNCGLAELVMMHEQDKNTVDLFHLHQAIKRLTLPMEMGERVKIMALSKEMDLPLRGFKTHDRRREL